MAASPSEVSEAHGGSSRALVQVHSGCEQVWDWLLQALPSLRRQGHWRF